MSVCLAFEKRSDGLIKKVVKVLSGPHVHTEMIVSQKHPKQIHTAYSAYMNSVFSRTFQREFQFDDTSYDFLRIDVTPDELMRISKTCEACADTNIPYNTTDMIYSVLPLRNPMEKDLFNAKTLFCSQAMVLILRECLEPVHHLQLPLREVNSRTVSPSQLFEKLSPFCTQVSCRQVLTA